MKDTVVRDKSTYLWPEALDGDGVDLQRRVGRLPIVGRALVPAVVRIGVDACVCIACILSCVSMQNSTTARTCVEGERVALAALAESFHGAWLGAIVGQGWILAAQGSPAVFDGVVGPVRCYAMVVDQRLPTHAPAGNVLGNLRPSIAIHAMGLNELRILVGIPATRFDVADEVVFPSPAALWCWYDCWDQYASGATPKVTTAKIVAPQIVPACCPCCPSCWR